MRTRSARFNGLWPGFKNGIPDNAAQFFARISSPGAPRQALYQTMIDSLTSAGVWGKLDALYVLSAADAATALTNLKSGSYGATATNTPTFTADQGYTFASTQYLDSGFNPATAGGQFAQDSACGFAWGDKVTAGGPSLASVRAATGAATSVEIWPRFSDDTFYGSVNVAEKTIAASQTTGAGFRAVSRTGSANFKAYNAASLLGTISGTSVSIPSFNIAVGGYSSALHNYGGNIYAAGFGGGLTDQNVTDLYNAVHVYLQAVAGVA